MASFNVLYEPWIGASDKQGRLRDYGLLDVLREAHELSEIVDPSPLIQFGIYRVLLAFVMDAYWPWELEHIEELLKRGHLDVRILENYIQKVGRDRFDLFDTRHPFLQVGPEPDISDRVGAVARLIQHLPSGSFAMHFYHAAQDTHAFSPAVCARALTAVAQFTTKGGQGHSPSVNGMPPWYVLVLGRNLFETLVLNTCPLSIFGQDDVEPPAWRTDRRVAPKSGRRCLSPLEAYTWRPRRIRLLPDEGGVCTYTGAVSDVLVRQVVFTWGLRSEGGWVDPQVPYSYRAKGPSPLRPKEGRQLWRDIGPLMLLRQADYADGESKIRFERPYVVQQWKDMVDDGTVSADQPLAIEVYGLRTDDMKIFEWQYERLSLPQGVLRNPRAPIQTRRALDIAEWVDYQLGKAIKMAYPGNGERNERALDAVIRMAREQYWDELHVVFMREYVPALAEQDPDDATAPAALEQEWRGHVRAVSRRSLEMAVEPLDSDAEALKRQVDARSYLWAVTRDPGAASTTSRRRRKR